MKCIFIKIEECTHEFFLFADDIDDKMKKKLRKLGFPSIYIHYPSDPDNKFTDLTGGIFQPKGFQCSAISVIEPTKDAEFSIEYNEKNNSIKLMLKGLFFSGNELEVYEDDGTRAFMLSQTTGILQSITINNDKGKPIKKPKDQWGIASPIDALAADTEYNSKGYKVEFQLYMENGMYKDGEVILD